ncbi:MAG: SWIM zinc finger family protein [Verrucomicrobia bacterium]|nr:SWIM zinc finger family protein [Cytophagales bacterium]
MLSFTEFEEDIPEKILERGLDYYENRQVEEVEKMGENEFSALVMGSEEYEVYVKIEKDFVTEYACTCPFDYGDVCKHIVAVLFYIRDADPDDFDTSTTSAQLALVFNEISEEEIRNFLLNNLKRNRKLREIFFDEFG